jgi:hypothetical protein
MFWIVVVQEETAASISVLDNIFIKEEDKKCQRFAKFVIAALIWWFMHLTVWCQWKTNRRVSMRSRKFSAELMVLILDWCILLR